MSSIDTSLGDSIRDAYLAEIQDWLPSFLSAASTEQLSPLENVVELLNLDAGDLRRIIAVHILLSDAIQDLVLALPRALRSPVTSSRRPRQLSRVIAGGIDWAATVRARSTGSPLDGGFVTRPGVRIFDVVENRILAWVLEAVTRQMALANPLIHGDPSANWLKRISHVGAVVATSQRTGWLRSVRPARPTAADLGLLATSRTLFYKRTLASAARLLRRYLDDPTPEDITELLIQRWFEPTRDWALFELVVLLRVERGLAAQGSRQRLRLTTSRSAFSTVLLPGGARVRLWYQSWPTTAGASEQLDAASHYGISTTGSRPDIVIEVELGGVSRGILLELKATRSAQYLGEGLMQILGYLRDRPTLLQREASAWLVAPAGAPMTSTGAQGRELWVVSADDVADAAVAAVASIA